MIPALILLSFDMGFDPLLGLVNNGLFPPEIGSMVGFVVLVKGSVSFGDDKNRFIALRCAMIVRVDLTMNDIKNEIRQQFYQF